ncbi:MAG: argininosuccinate lyase [Halobacteriales archaeon]|nr:argininosuccinate lyase [Halobacteriales archaeon]
MTNGGNTTGDVVRRDRFSGGPAREFLSSMADDERIFQADITIDRAHVVMLAEQTIIDDATAGDILEALAAVEAAGHDALPAGEDVHAAIETAVIDRIGPDGGRMHTARSRNDEVATCIRWQLRTELLEAIEATIDAREALLSVAADHTETIMPGYTHLQPAQPTTVAHWCCSYAQAIGRDTARLFDAYDRVNTSPLGAAAFGGTPFPIDRERTAALLGFDGVVENSMDAVSTRDFLLESVNALATLATTLSGLAEDLIVFSNKGYVELDDDYASTSSIMPQKKNPDSLELVRGVAGDAVGELTGLYTTLKSLPRAYNRDLQRATPHGWAAVDAVTDAIDVAGGAIATATWPEETLAAEADSGFATATGVADRLAMAGIPFRTAHELVAEAAEAGGDFAAIAAAAEDVLGEPLEAVVDPDAIETALDPHESVAMRDSVGGPAPAAVTETIEAADRQLKADRDSLETTREALATADEQLTEVVSTYV